MNVRKEIEKLIYWYVPVYIVGYFLASATLVFYKAIPSSEMELTALGLAMTYFTKNLPSVVIAIWIYQVAKKTNQKYILWTLFGLVAHIFAAIAFIVLNVLEGKFNISKEKLKEELVETDL
jgi:ABC-type spermidine/putrescine transport system permease subunit II